VLDKLNTDANVHLTDVKNMMSVWYVYLMLSGHSSDVSETDTLCNFFHLKTSSYSSRLDKTNYMHGIFGMP
jgi:hypothetical protein